MAKKWLMMKCQHGEPEKSGLQVYGEKFLEYDKVWHLAEWLNRHNGVKWFYFVKEIEE